MPPMIRHALRIVFYISCALVAALSLAPSAALPPASIGDKAEHVIAYAALGLLGSLGFERAAGRTILGLAALGGAIELLQAFSPGRSPDVLDAAADFIGACVGCGAVAAVRGITAMSIDRSRSPAATPSSSHNGASCQSN